MRFAEEMDFRIGEEVEYMMGDESAYDARRSFVLFIINGVFSNC